MQLPEVLYVRNAYSVQLIFLAKDEINVPIALSAFRDNFFFSLLCENILAVFLLLGRSSVRTSVLVLQFLG